MNVLLVDDDPAMAPLVERMLKSGEEKPFKLLHRASLAEGIQCLKQHKAEVVLLDLNLPDSTGLETISRLIERVPAVPVVVFTGVDHDITAVMTLRQGAQDYLFKPELSARDLLRAIHHAIERKQLQEALRKSQERFDLVIRGSTDGVWDWSLETNQVYYSPRWKEMFGFEDQEVGSDFKEWENRIHPDDLARSRVEIRDYLQGRAHQLRLEHRMIHRDGTYRWILARGVALRDSTHRPYRMAGTHLDITETKQKESALEYTLEKLQESETRFRQLAEHINEVFWITNPSGSEMIYLSPAFESIWGRSVASLYLQPKVWDEAIHDEDRDRVRASFAQKAAVGGFDEVYRIVRPDGSIRWIRDRGFPVRGPEGKTYRVVGIAEDITQHMGIQHELMRAHEQLTTEHERLKSTQSQLVQAEKVNSIGRLAAGIAHEVKNPLATISMGIEFLTQSGPPQNETIKMVLGEMDDAVQRANAITRGLLDYSAHLSVDLKEDDLNAVVEKALLLARHEVIRKNIRVVRELAPAVPRFAMDRNKIIQVLLNLMINSIHAMGEGGTLTLRTRLATIGELDPKGAAAAAAESESPLLTLEIEDTGTGIPEENLEKIFDPFFTTKPTGKGTGLGLAVAKNIVELHGAGLSFSNVPGSGARATIRFLL